MFIANMLSKTYLAVKRKEWFLYCFQQLISRDETTFPSLQKEFKEGLSVAEEP